MTLPDERTRAVIQVANFLRRLSSPYLENGIKKIPTPVRQEARRLLRHYPNVVDMLEPDKSFDNDLARRLLEADADETC